MVIKELKISGEDYTTLWKYKKKNNNTELNPLEKPILYKFSINPHFQTEKTFYEGQLCVDFIFLAKNER